MSNQDSSIRNPFPKTLLKLFVIAWAILVSKVYDIGIIIGNGKIQMDPKKLKGVADWPKPKTPTDICKFLGFTGYYQYFIQGYSKITHPLLDLIKKATVWEWGEWQQTAFEELKTHMCSRPILTQPNFEKPFFLQMDASAYGMGAILSQEGEHHATASQKPKLHPIAYYSTTFTPTEQNYDIYERELLAIMKALTHWRHYLGWTKTPFTILIDHANLQYWKAPQKLNCHTAQWHTNLQEYDFVIKHIPRKINTPADELSRPPNSDQGENDNQDQTLLKSKLFINTTHMANLPESSKWNLMTLVHNHPMAGHLGCDEMTRKATEILPWIGMCQWIADYVKGCATCQQNKIFTHHTKIPLYRIMTKEGTLPF